MKKIALVLTLLLVSVSIAFAALLVTDSGISKGTADNKILERKSSWDAAETAEWIVAWMKIPPGSDSENGTLRYQYKVRIIAPDNTAFTEGPFSFDSEGYAKVSKQVSYFNNLKTTFSPKPAQGKWEFEIDMVDKKENKEDLGCLVPFYLTGSDTSQSPTDINEAKDKAVGDAADMGMLAVFNTAKQFGAQQEQQRQAAVTTSTTSTTLATITSAPVITKKVTKEAASNKKAAKKPVKKKK